MWMLDSGKLEALQRHLLPSLQQQEPQPPQQPQQELQPVGNKEQNNNDLLGLVASFHEATTAQKAMEELRSQASLIPGQNNNILSSLQSSSSSSAGLPPSFPSSLPSSMIHQPPPQQVLQEASQGIHHTNASSNNSTPSGLLSDLLSSSLAAPMSIAEILEQHQRERSSFPSLTASLTSSMAIQLVQQQQQQQQGGGGGPTNNLQQAPHRHSLSSLNSSSFSVPPPSSLFTDNGAIASGILAQQQSFEPPPPTSSSSPAAVPTSSPSARRQQHDHTATNLKTEDAGIDPLYRSKHSFPEKIYFMLTQVEKQGRQDAVSFVANGTAFLIHKPRVFEVDVMPLFFSSRRMSSFQRQLNIYGFTRINEGPWKGAYQHKHFQKGKKELLTKIKRSPGPTSSSSAAAAAAVARQNNT